MQVTTPPEAVGFSAAGLARIRPWLQAHVDGGRLPGALVSVARHGEVALLEAVGLRDREARAPIGVDTLFRIYSMTKPVTAVAVMMLCEAGHIGLDDPVARFIPGFERLQVQVIDGEGRVRVVPARRPMTVRHLLTHTAGFGYGTRDATPAEALYLDRHTDFAPNDGPLAEVVERLLTIPLLCEPGSGWHYGVSSDVLGRLVEVVAGQPFADFLGERIFEPLCLRDTGFSVPGEKAGRLAALYARTEDDGMTLLESPRESVYTRPVSTHSGGAGLISTLGDYFRFTELLRRKGELDGVRLLRRETVEEMTRNQLPGDIAELGQPTFNETSTRGIGFGLGFSVLIDSRVARLPGSVGEYAWGGMASTAFWNDPVRDLGVILMTQLRPSDAYPLRRELRELVYRALRPT